MLNTKMIGNKIAEARKKINMSQAGLAGFLFISPQAVENGNGENQCRTSLLLTGSRKFWVLT